MSGPSESLETCGLQAQMLELEVSPLHGVHFYSVSILVTLGVCVLNEGNSSLESVCRSGSCAAFILKSPFCNHSYALRLKGSKETMSLVCDTKYRNRGLQIASANLNCKSVQGIRVILTCVLNVTQRIKYFFPNTGLKITH